MLWKSNFLKIPMVFLFVTNCIARNIVQLALLPSSLLPYKHVVAAFNAYIVYVSIYGNMQCTICCFCLLWAVIYMLFDILFVVWLAGLIGVKIGYYAYRFSCCVSYLTKIFLTTCVELLAYCLGVSFCVV